MKQTLPALAAVLVVAVLVVVNNAHPGFGRPPHGPGGPPHGPGGPPHGPGGPPHGPGGPKRPKGNGTDEDCGRNCTNHNWTYKVDENNTVSLTACDKNDSNLIIVKSFDEKLRKDNLAVNPSIIVHDHNNVTKIIIISVKSRLPCIITDDTKTISQIRENLDQLDNTTVQNLATVNLKGTEFTPEQSQALRESNPSVFKFGCRNRFIRGDVVAAGSESSNSTLVVQVIDNDTLYRIEMEKPQAPAEEKGGPRDKDDNNSGDNDHRRKHGDSHHGGSHGGKGKSGTKV